MENKNINQGLELLKSELEKENFEVQIVKSGRARIVSAKKGKSEIKIRIKTRENPKHGGGNGKLCLAWIVRENFQTDYVALIDISSKRIWLMDKNEIYENAQQFKNGVYRIYMYIEHNVKIRNKKERNFVDDFNEWRLNNKIEKITNIKKRNQKLNHTSLEELERSLKEKIKLEN